MWIFSSKQIFHPDEEAVFTHSSIVQQVLQPGGRRAAVTAVLLFHAFLHLLNLVLSFFYISKEL